MVNRDKWEFYKDRKGEHRWRVISVNGRVVGASTEGYANKQAAEKNAMRFGYKKRKGMLLTLKHCTFLLMRAVIGTLLNLVQSILL
ncbi:MAG: DUF1508 domain-containing protein [Candidatus Gracilibacteria bacterium]|nr:DUF1508 domain-containing protein [Candidatus Gracilibacteria bacterium]